MNMKGYRKIRKVKKGNIRKMMIKRIYVLIKQMNRKRRVERKEQQEQAGN